MSDDMKKWLGDKLSGWIVLLLLKACGLAGVAVTAATNSLILQVSAALAAATIFIVTELLTRYSASKAVATRTQALIGTPSPAVETDIKTKELQILDPKQPDPAPLASISNIKSPGDYRAN